MAGGSGMSFLSPPAFLDQGMGNTGAHCKKIPWNTELYKPIQERCNREIQKSKLYLSSKSWDLGVILLLTQISFVY